jgi:hypothetical protein
VLRPADATQRRKGSGMCNLCSSSRTANDILLFASPLAGAAGRLGNTVGTYLCADLNCSRYARGLEKLPLPQSENLPPEERAQRLRERLAGFIDRILAE